jgi:SAM-dependent methyltransferase
VVRTAERLRAHYEVEKELAARLRTAPAAERRRLYGTLYDELFRRVPDHPQLVARAAPAERARDVEWQLRFLARYLHRDACFVEMGAGDGALCASAATHVREAWAVDVSEEISRGEGPANMHRAVADGIGVPVPPGTVHVVYSNQLIEHLHPDDARAHVQAVHEALVPGGVFVCITPNRLTGPHDVSEGFDPVATGFHLREYSTADLAGLLREAGFRHLRVLVGSAASHGAMPAGIAIAIEKVFRILPHRWRRRLGRAGAVRTWLGVRMVACKTGA